MHRFIKESASTLGFDACGIAKAEMLADDADFLRQWLADGKHGKMAYLANNFDKRTNPQLLVPGCKSVVVLLSNYFPVEKQPDNAPKIAKYAYSATDYHFVIKERLKKLEQILINQYGNDIFAKEQHLFVDSAPVLERRWAQRAGLGWIGKHMQLIAPNLGSYCFISIMMLNVTLEYETETYPNRCGKCTRCIDACPTQALNGTSMDARKCISYQTIENKDIVDDEIAGKLSGCALGCDICADVCPWNKKWAHPHQDKDLKPTEAIHWLWPDWENMTKEKFKLTFKNSSVQRACYDKLVQNIALLKKNCT